MFANTQKFDETVNLLLVETHREDNGCDYGLLCLIPDSLEFCTTTGSILIRLSTLSDHHTSIDSKTTDGERKNEAKWKKKLNGFKSYSTAERGFKKMLL